MKLRSLLSVYLLIGYVFSVEASADPSVTLTMKKYNFDDGTTFVYRRPGLFDWFGNSFANIGAFTKNTFSQENIGNLALILGSTGVLIYYDQQIYDSVSTYGKKHNISQDSHGSSISELPRDKGEWFYFIGDGRIPLVIAGIIGGAGYSNDDLRMMSTASQLLEASLSVGLVAQIIKQSTGRETPEASTREGGDWHGFVGPKEYFTNRTSYDAMPSGHMATAVATITVLAENYHEYKTSIYTTGIIFSSLLGFQMINNGVHWAGDYPIGIALGYSMGKLVVNNNREVIHNRSSSRKGKINVQLLPSGRSVVLQSTYHF